MLMLRNQTERSIDIHRTNDKLSVQIKKIDAVKRRPAMSVVTGCGTSPGRNPLRTLVEHINDHPRLLIFGFEGKLAALSHPRRISSRYSTCSFRTSDLGAIAGHGAIRHANREALAGTAGRTGRATRNYGHGGLWVSCHFLGTCVRVRVCVCVCVCVCVATER
jgi:hypothetical protein